ncbi:MAG TPA: arginine--tRNA ligase, partial [Elusimicrobiales bacterium]|nr:arginine--tRNA ligase [Elusimicrobiales bacterium]
SFSGVISSADKDDGGHAEEMTPEKLSREIESVLLSHYSAQASAALPAPQIAPAPEHVAADVALSWPMAACKLLKKNPLALAEEAAGLLARISVAGGAPQASKPGFINISLSDKALWANLKQCVDSPQAAVRLESPPQGRLQIEFVSANPTGPLHVASGRGASLGDSLVRLHNALGIETAAEYYVNDAGAQTLLLGESLKARAAGQEPPEKGYHGEYLKDLAKELPAEHTGWNEAQYAEFAMARMLRGHQEDMKLFRVEFKTWFRESELHKQQAWKTTLERLKALGKVYEKDGAVWFGSSSSESEDDKDRVLVRSDGRPTYFLNDIAYHHDKYGRGYDRVIDIWGADHHGYVPRMKAAVSALGYEQEAFRVIIHQLVMLNKGGQAVKMSKRAGEFITLRELVDDVGADACRFFFAARTPNSHLNFDIDLAKKKTQENPVYYVQYVHARICSMERAAEGKYSAAPLSPAEPLVKQERLLLAKLLWYQETLKTCVRDLSPHHLAAYLLELSGLFHPFYDACRVLDESKPELSAARLYLCRGVKNVIGHGLGLLGVSAPEQM